MEFIMKEYKLAESKKIYIINLAELADKLQLSHEAITK